MRLLLLTLFIASTFVSLDAKEERPNLIFILTDDQRDNSFSAMGHPWVETPNIDRLLSMGVRFENAYIAEPTCRPSRASILLGNHERVNRNGFSSAHKMNAHQWEDSYPVLLQKGGYETGYVGKWHVSMEGLAFEQMFDFWDGHNGHGSFYFDQIQPNGERRKVTTNRHHTNNALRFLRERSGSKPFCLSVCYATPHGSKVKKMHSPLDESASENPNLKGHPIYGGKYRELDIDYPMQAPDNPYSHIPKHVMDQDKGRNKTYSYVYDPDTSKEHHFRYYQMITEIDQMVGELVQEVEALGIAENTIIIFASDHGLLMGEYGMGGKGLLYDLSSKFPCFVYDPASPRKMQGTSRKEVVSSLDLTVTLLDYAEAEPSEFMTGRSLKPLVRGQKPNPKWREGLFLENLYTGRDTPIQEGYVDGEWKYIRYSKAPHPYAQSDVESPQETVFEMLFSLKNDPTEIDNLAENPEYKEKLLELRKECLSELGKLLKLRKNYSNKYGLPN
ncbi:sulfatase-like hydrolase/transferase [Pelagicoccus mobilis]|uniref:Sulfatase-like hydrolase/transferase n=1 Tax=Pelagicoccus mobilis TaxID=415221 RepID=A0A934VPF9_9BACT|nr:sulfatase-like hydrolase/transferase [Pelagicoccus mobilis]MBK1875780.1 sulfatase-like hydrolase/transferase [Pelagicoccus mobilis]